VSRDSVLSRASAILGAFDEFEPELSLAELTDRSGLARSTTHRLATELADLGMLERTPRGYRIGLRLWEVGELAAVSLALRESALPHLLTLYAATGENVHLAVLDGTEALYVARLTGTASIPTLSRMGGRLPLHTTGVGKALLATRDEEWLAAYFRTPLERETVFSVTDERRLRAEFEQARAAGYATTQQEMTLGNVSIAAALPEVAGIPRSAVGVVAHLGRADEKRFAPLVVQAAATIGRELLARRAD
jgi:DNA-binding IclR family transcriptional regulator